MNKYPFVHIEQLADNLWVLEEMGSNIFIVKGEEKVLIVDTAYGLTDLKSVVRDLCGEMPIVVINSHGHGDHNSGNNQFDCVHVGRFDEPNSHKEYDQAGKDRMVAFMGSKLEGYPFDADAWNPGPAPHIEPVADGDVIDIGGMRFTVIETPGHSMGSIALYEADKRWMFTGDTALTWEVWGQLATSVALRYYAQSLEHLATYVDKIDYVFPAHSVEKRPASCGRYWLPPCVLTIYAEGTRAIVDGKVEGKPYEEINPRFAGFKYVHFEIGGMAYDPARI